MTPCIPDCQSYKLKYLTGILLFSLLDLFLVQSTMCQEKIRSTGLGFSYGMGSQQVFPFMSKDYNYNTKNIKLLFNYPIRKGKIALDLRIEPSIFLAKHQLLNEYFVQPEYGPDYLYLREVYSRQKTITEYALNIGLQLSINPEGRFSWFIMASTGPMYTDTATERLAKGFAFSDIFGFGMQYKTEHLVFEIRPGLRHVSNLDLQFPNCGHNSTAIDFGILFPVFH